MAPATRLRETPSQTAGPYVHIGLMPNLAGIPCIYPRDAGLCPAPPWMAGERIEIVIRLHDGLDAPVTDAVLEMWQPDHNGLFASSGAAKNAGGGFSVCGWGRQATDAHGCARFATVKPGRVLAPDGSAMAPHISIWIVARGINVGLQTRLYFDDEQEANGADWLLRRVPEGRRATLVAHKTSSASVRTYEMKVYLQGENETVFLDV